MRRKKQRSKPGKRGLRSLDRRTLLENPARKARTLEGQAALRGVLWQQLESLELLGAKVGAKAAKIEAAAASGPKTARAGSSVEYLPGFAPPPASRAESGLLRFEPAAQSARQAPEPASSASQPEPVAEVRAEPSEPSEKPRQPAVAVDLRPGTTEESDIALRKKLIEVSGGKEIAVWIDFSEKYGVKGWLARLSLSGLAGSDFDFAFQRATYILPEARRRNGEKGYRLVLPGIYAAESVSHDDRRVRYYLRVNDALEIEEVSKNVDDARRWFGLRGTAAEQSALLRSKAKEAQRDFSLPPFVGTPRQIEYAEKIRTQLWGPIFENGESLWPYLKSPQGTTANASWFIDRSKSNRADLTALNWIIRSQIRRNGITMATPPSVSEEFARRILVPLVRAAADAEAAIWLARAAANPEILPDMNGIPGVSGKDWRFPVGYDIVLSEETEMKLRQELAASRAQAILARYQPSELWQMPQETREILNAFADSAPTW